MLLHDCPGETGKDLGRHHRDLAVVPDHQPGFVFGRCRQERNVQPTSDRQGRQRTILRLQILIDRRGTITA